jgi:hypothetical protein
VASWQITLSMHSLACPPTHTRTPTPIPSHPHPLTPAHPRPCNASLPPYSFADLKPLYSDSDKAARLGALMAGLESALSQTGALPPLPGDVVAEQEEASPPAGPESGEADACLPSPSPNGTEAAAADGAAGAGAPGALVWVRFYLAQHHDKLGNTEEALAMTDACIKVSVWCGWVGSGGKG